MPAETPAQEPDASMRGAAAFEKAWMEVKIRAIEIFNDFESESSVTIRLVPCGDRLWAVVRTDDDNVPAIIWNSPTDDGGWEIREVWLDEAAASALLDLLAHPATKTHG